MKRGHAEMIEDFGVGQVGGKPSYSMCKCTYCKTAVFSIKFNSKWLHVLLGKWMEK